MVEVLELWLARRITESVVIYNIYKARPSASISESCPKITPMIKRTILIHKK